MRVRDWVHTWAVVLGEKVSRVDLCIDLNAELPEVNIKGGEVVSYAKSKKEFYIGENQENHVLNVQIEKLKEN